MLKKEKYISRLLIKLKKLVNGKRSTKMSSEKLNSSQPVPPQDSPSAYTLHRSTRTLPYDNFITVLTEESLDPLIISGQPPVDELVTAWENICEQYNESIKTELSKSVFEAYKKVVITESKIKIIHSAILYLRNLGYDEEVAQVLNQLGYGKINKTIDQNELERYLKRYELKSSILVVLLNQYRMQYKALKPEDTSVKLEYSDYMDELAILSKHQGYNINAKKITVQEYCSIVNGYISYSNSMRKQYQNSEKR